MDGGVSGMTEAFARVKIDAPLEDADRSLTDGSSVPFERRLDHLKDGGCGVALADGVPFGSTGAHREPRCRLVENDAVEAVPSLSGGVFNPCSDAKTSAPVFRKGGATSVRFGDLHCSVDVVDAPTSG